MASSVDNGLPDPLLFRRNWYGGLLTAIIALGVNIALFNLMPLLLHRGHTRPVVNQLAEQINVIRLKQPESPVRKIEKTPEKPPEKKPLQPKEPSSVVPTKLILPFDINPKLPAAPAAPTFPAIPPSSLTDAKLDDIFSVGDLDLPLVVMAKIPPFYPLHAKRRGIEGWVRVRFIVHEDGHVDNIIVDASKPPGIFDDSVIRAVSGWRFKAGTIGGTPVKAWAETTVRFKLD